MKDFRARRTHAGALAGREHDCQARSGHHQNLRCAP
jgi:hypothetical protein